MSPRHPRPGLPPDVLTVAWQSASLLLAYPDERLADSLDLVGRAARDLPASVGSPLLAAVERLAGVAAYDLRAAYVETFDTRRRSNLFLTYFAHGDTRKRGVALLRFQSAYRRSGFVLSESELPDHLCVVLEYAATIDQRLGWDLLLDHRAGLELLRLALREADAPWAPVLDAVHATLPVLRGEEWEVVRRLAAEGPPEEEVGLTPYAVPTLADAGSGTGAGAGAGGTEPTPLPMPAYRGERR